jgi:hypothetical protein
LHGVVFKKSAPPTIHQPRPELRPSDLIGFMETLHWIDGPACPQPSGLNTRRFDGGLFASFEAGRIGRGTKLPPQFGQRPPSLLSAQSRQNVHSNEQITASVAAGGKSLSQHSQLGRSSSICHLARLGV